MGDRVGSSPTFHTKTKVTEKSVTFCFILFYLHVTILGAETQIAQDVPLLDGEAVFKKLRDKYVRK